MPAGLRLLDRAMYKRSEPSSSMVRQELPMSCGAACVRQLLRDAGADVSEATIRDLASFHPEFGMPLEGLRDALNELHVAAGAYECGTALPEQFDRFAHVVPFIALVRTPLRHFVIVDEVRWSEVRVRDPAGTPEGPSVGAIGWMDRQAFVERWTRAGNGVAFLRPKPIVLA
jgi:ABC-type bacteriocin/lantibiotic exporter with double-glycine peptidase domain